MVGTVGGRHVDNNKGDFNAKTDTLGGRERGRTGGGNRKKVERRKDKWRGKEICRRAGESWVGNSECVYRWR